MGFHQEILALVLTVTLAVHLSSGTMLTIKPNSTNVTCPTENTCLTLSEYAQNHSEYLNQSIITLQFLPGNHTLDVNLTVTNTQAQYMEILGSTISSTVKCSGNVGFDFRDISEVRVSDMRFISCGRGYWTQDHPYYSSILNIYGPNAANVVLYYAIQVSFVQLIEITNCVFNDSVGTAVGIVNSTALVSGNNNFSSNCRKCSGVCPNPYECYVHGAGIFAVGSNVTFHGNNIFDGNSAAYGGGVFAWYSDVTFHNNNTFHRNSAGRGHGGGVCAWFSNVAFHGNNIFYGNSAVYGGGVYAQYSDLTFHNNSTFYGNSADSLGGGLCVRENSDVRISGTATFRDNMAYEGGGIWSSGSTINISGTSDTTVRNNKAQDGGGIFLTQRSTIDISNTSDTTVENNNAQRDGGGIYSVNSNTVMSGNMGVLNNTAQQAGGGIYSRNSSIDVSGDMQVQNNMAEEDGGGIFLSQRSTINISNTSDITVGNNNAQRDGGGIYLTATSTIKITTTSDITVENNNAQRDGGGIFSENSNIDIRANMKIENNTAKQDGGGIYSRDSSIDMSGDMQVQNNTAEEDGGGIFLSQRSTINLSNTSDITVENNGAQRDGGGIFLSQISTIKITTTSDITVENNRAQRDGGGIYPTATSTIKITTTSDITVENNNAQRDGGGIFSENSSIVIKADTKIENNMAKQDGGGIYTRRTDLIFSGINKFTANSARQGGGIYAAASSMVDCVGINSFIANRAEISGGGILVDNVKLKLDGSNYFKECTARYEGGGIFTYDATVNLPGHTKFLSNSATLRGGGISARWSHLSFLNSSNFSKNTAEMGGGIFTDNSTLDFGDVNTIESNTADIGGGIYMLNSSLEFPGNNSFILNSATKDGGGIYARENGTISLSGSNSFQGNKAAERGGGICMMDSNLTSRTRNVSNNVTTDFVHWVMNFPGYSEFCNNTAVTGGGLYSFESILDFPETHTLNFTSNMATNAGGGFATIGSTLNITGSMAFDSNSAMSGGGMYVEDTKVSMSGNNYFNQNHAQYEGGAVYIRAGKMNLNGADCFVRNSAAMRGGSIFAICTNLTFSGTSTIHKSTSQQGGAIHVVASSITFECAIELHKNSAQYGGAVLSEKSIVTFGKPSCRECLGSDVIPEPGSSLINNTALRGGAMDLDHHSSIRFHPSASVLFNYNKAREYGGAIFVTDTVGQKTCPPAMYLPSRNECFFHVISNEISQMGKINLTFEGNTAGKSGSVLYGGMLNKCNYSYSEEYTDTIDLFNRSIAYKPYTAETAAISSDPTVCFCSEGGSPQCEYKVQKEDRFPGQKVNVSVIALDQTYTPTYTEILTNLISDEKHNSRVCESFSEDREGSCTNRSYTITSPRTSSKLLLYPTTASGNPIPAVLNVTFQDCPIGFEQSNSSYECICDHRLQKFTNTCDIETQTLLRPEGLNGTFWVNASFNNETLDGYIYHYQCPLNYCTKQQRYINLNNPDEQCDFNHAGLLCGRCKENFSLVLGSFQCKECSSEYLAFLIPFALAGVSLVILLFLLKLTVATGTLHGLIFYANIVAANHQIFFPPDAHILARIFIAWLNLDLGIETCFYNGMDAYGKSWLQFLFPLYIWGIVGLLIYMSKRSRRVTQLLGTNPVAVLDTLFLLSYTKLLRTIITALSLTTLHYPQMDSVVWFYDASIPILKLIPFFIAALIFLVFLFLPYTLLLLLGQWVWTKSEYKLIRSCWAKCPRLKLGLKAILDPYYAPYKPKHCYWTGLLLLLRCLLLLVSAFNISGEKDSVNLLAILSTVGGILVMFALSGRVYKSWYLNALELSFLLNLSILTAATYHVKLVNGDQAVVAYISVGIAFLTFVGIITYHIILRMKWKLRHLRRYFTITKKSSCSENRIDIGYIYVQNHHPPRKPTTTVVGLRSPLDLINVDCDVIETEQ